MCPNSWKNVVTSPNPNKEGLVGRGFVKFANITHKGSTLFLNNVPLGTGVVISKCPYFPVLGYKSK